MKILIVLFISFFAFACNSGSGSNNNRTDTSATGNRWQNEDQVNFMDNCINEAGRNLEKDSAQAYCACVLIKAQSVYPAYKEANEKMTLEQMNEWAEECLKR